MDVTEGQRQDLCAQAGFTLIESMIAMELFVGVVFLLVSVFNGFLMDDFAAKTNKAFTIAESQLSEAAESKIFQSTQRDTSGFHVVQTVTINNNVAELDVEVQSQKRDTLSAPLMQKKQPMEYVRLSRVIPVP